jgi:hypothetical protein
MGSTHTGGLSISGHAVRRWIERVDSTAGPLEARLALAQHISMGRVRPTPRHWTNARPAPGLTFVYWSQRPSVCVLAIDGVVVTVLTRALCAATAPRIPAALSSVRTGTHRSTRLADPVSTWRWDGRRDAA